MAETCAIDYVIDGLVAELAVERELGVRSFEFDREVLAEILSWSREPAQPARAQPAAGAETPRAQSAAGAETPRTQSAAGAETPLAKPAPSSLGRSSSSSTNASSTNTYDFVFLHHRPMTAPGAEMMEKILANVMRRTRETAPVLDAGELPRARVYIVLGGLALKKWFPYMHAAPGQWRTGDAGEQVLITYSPDFILRFGLEPTAAMLQLKRDMLQSLKSALQRVAAAAREA